MAATAIHKVIVRMAAPQSEELFNIIFSRYPKSEWGTFVRFGFHLSGEQLVLTLTHIDAPAAGDLNPKTWVTEIQAQYTSRMLARTESHPFAVGFVHSHPEAFHTGASASDDDMESYYSLLLESYTPGRPFASLIFAMDAQQNMSATGRVYWNQQWVEVDNFIIEGREIAIENYQHNAYLSEEAIRKVERLASQFSIESAQKLARSTVGIVGASGTGSPCIELLARAGVGKLIIVDPELFDESNLERVHGSGYEDVADKTAKVVIAGRHVKSINPTCEVLMIKGRIPQEEVIYQLLSCDIVLGCTDLHSARAALSDMSIRYLVPVIDVGVVMEGKDGKVTGQVVQINRLFPKDPCVYCRDMINSKLAEQELMSPEVQTQRQLEAAKAKKEGRNAGAYWLDKPQLNTVGYLTTLAGSLMISYVVGYLTGRFDMKNNRVEINLSVHGIQVVDKNEEHDPDCSCRQNQGTADQDVMAIISTAPAHWHIAEFLLAQTAGR